MLDAQFSKRAKPIVIAGPSGHRERIRQAMEVLFPGSSQTEHRYGLDYVELLDGATTDLGTLRVTPFPVVHASGARAFALRVECEGKVISYSGDTEWTETLLEAARGADLFVCESYFLDKKVKFHLDYETLRSHLSELACPRIVVTHMSQGMLDRVSEVDVEAAEDGKRIVL